MGYRMVILLTLLLHLSPPTLIDAIESVTEKDLIDHLLEDYQMNVRPVINYTSPVVVTIETILHQIVRLAEREQHLTTKIWLRMRWNNSLLTWKPEEWDNITKIRLKHDSVWTPDIYLQEDTGSELSSGPYKYATNIQMRWDGDHYWLIPVKLVSSCHVDIKKFPFDQQNCRLVFTSWTSDQSEIDLEVGHNPVIDPIFKPSQEWKLLNATQTKVVKMYPCCAKPFVEIHLHLRIERRPFYYILNLVLPCIVQMVIILMTFFLPPDSGERIMLVITILLVFSLYLQILGNNLPKSSNSTPALSVFYMTAMIESAASLIATCFVLAAHFKGTGKGVEPIPSWLRSFFLLRIAPLFGVKQKPRDVSQNYAFNNEFVVMEEETNNGDEGCHDNETLSTEGSDDDERRDIPACNLTPLVEGVQVVTSLIREEKSQEEISEEWKILAKCMDRFFFLVFLFTFFISSTVILLPGYISRSDSHDSL